MSRATTPTYVLLNQITLAANSSSVTFSNIPQNYGDLVLVISGILTTSNDNINLNVNGTGTSGSRVFMFGDGSSASSGTSTTLTVGFPGTVVSSTVLQIFDYSATDKHKTMLFRSNNTNSGVSAQAERWANTAAITSLGLSPNSRQFTTGHTFYLYGLVA